MCVQLVYTGMFISRIAKGGSNVEAPTWAKLKRHNYAGPGEVSTCSSDANLCTWSVLWNAVAVNIQFFMEKFSPPRAPYLFLFLYIFYPQSWCASIRIAYKLLRFVPFLPSCHALQPTKLPCPRSTTRALQPTKLPCPRSTTRAPSQLRTIDRVNYLYLEVRLTLLL